MKNILKDKRNIFYIAGVMVGIALIILGINCFSSYNRYYGDYRALAFGADFYTEMHEVSASIANSLRELYHMAKFFMVSFFVGAGAIDICVFGSKLMPLLIKPKEEVEPTVQEKQE